jgi:hypothetical protein
MSICRIDQRAAIDIIQQGDSVYYARLTIYDTHMTIGPAPTEVDIKKMLMAHLQDIRLTARIKEEQNLNLSSLQHCLGEYKKAEGL